MRRALIALLICSLLFSNAAPVFAWSDPGHRIVALIAWSRLNEPTRARLLEILKAHPRFDEDFTEEMPDGVSDADEETQRRWVISQAATWSDLVRGGSAERRSHNRPKWHYINRPIFLTEGDEDALSGQLSVNLVLDLPSNPSGDNRDLNVIQAIKLCENRLSNPHIGDRTKALYLCWLFHLVGDLHQPLHSSALFSQVQFPDGDKGGNDIRVGTGANGSKLHGRWDGLLGNSGRFNDVLARAADLTNNSDMQQLGANAVAATNPEEWLAESYTLANDVAYSEAIRSAVADAEENRDNDIGVIGLEETYFETAGTEARKRVVQAGYRLAAMVERMVGTDGAPDHGPEIAAAAPELTPVAATRVEILPEEEEVAASATDRLAKVKSIQDLRVMPIAGPDGAITGFNIIALAVTDEPGWTNGRLIPHTPVVNPSDNFLRFDFVADTPTAGGSQHFVVAQQVVPTHGAVGVEVFASTNSLKRPELEFIVPAREP